MSKWIPISPLAWARNKKFRGVFPTYRDYVLWVDEVIERIGEIEKLVEGMKIE